MTNAGFYDTAEPGFGDQMDPLGTAKPAEPAAEKPAATATVTIGKTKVKKKMSTWKKVGIGAGGFLAAFLGMVLVLDPGQPKVNASPKPQVPVPAPANPAQMMGAEAAGGATVMGGAPAPGAASPAAPEAAVQGAAPAAPAAAAAAPVATPQAATPAPAAAAPAVAPAAAAPAAAPAAPTAAAAPAPATGPAATASAAPTQAVQSATSPKAHGKEHSVAKDVTPSATPEQLASRVAVLERRLARYERAEAQDRARSAKEAAVRAKHVASEKALPVVQPIVEAKKPVALVNDMVRVVGVSTHHGVTTALVDFGGIKSRVGAGDSIPGLGTVQTVAVDAAGNPVVEINGVRYQ